MITDYNGVPVKFLRHDLAQVAEIVPIIDRMPDDRVIIIHKMIQTYGHPRIPDWYKDELGWYIRKELSALQQDAIDYAVMDRQIADLSIGELEEKSDEYYTQWFEEYKKTEEAG